MTKLKAPSVKTTFTPLHDLVLVREEKADAFVGQIYVPPTAIDSGAPVIGEVIAVGPDARVEVGDRVTYGRQQAQTLEVDSVKHHLVQYKSLVGVVTTAAV